MLVTLKLRTEKYSIQTKYLDFFNVYDNIVISLRG